MNRNFKEWRKALGLTQEASARALGLTARNVQKYEAGEHEPTEPVRRLMSAMEKSKGQVFEPWGA
jgi:DNA-binding transcriptional regulator YiaG